MRAVLVLLVVSCSGPRVPQAPGPATYDVKVGSELRVEARLPGGVFGVDDGAERFLRDVEIEEGGAWRPLKAMSCARACRLRYRFLLREAAAAFHDPDVAIAYGDAIQAPASTWLLHGAASSVQMRFDRDVVSGMRLEAFTALGPWRVRHTGPIDIAIAPVSFAMDDEAIERWITEAAGAVERIYGRPPAKRFAVIVTPGDGNEIDGKTLGPSISMRLGTALRDARESWVLIHELIHVASPAIGAPHRWLEEGLATYLEPIVRVRAGMIPEDAMWRDLIREAPKGQVGSLEDWGPMYWGGAVFYLRADIELRRQGRSLLEVVRTFDDVTARWSATRLLGLLPDLYPQKVDLDALWKSLGVSLQGDRVIYDDAAPLAAIRRGIAR